MIKNFSLIELLIVITIIAVLAGLILVSLPRSVPGVAETRANIIHMETALDLYKKEQESYPLSQREGHINLSDPEDGEVKAMIVELLKLHSFVITDNAMPKDHWGNDLYLIYSHQYDSSVHSISQKHLPEKVYLNPRSFQLISSGPDGSFDSCDDNVGNFDQK